MKYLLNLIIMLNAGCVMAGSPPKQKVTFHVTDVETSKVLTNATVTVFNDTWETKKVDLNGFCTFTGKGISFGWKGTGKHVGYYDDMSGVTYKKLNKILNRWEPWNATVEIKLRPIKNPVPMVHKRIESLKIPVFNKPVGFDLEVGDWVAPYGKGKVSDFVFTAYEKITGAKVELGYSLNFSNKLDGIQEYLIDKKRNSSFILPYKAPEQNYDSGLKKYLTSTGNIDVKTNLKMYNNDVYYIFRVRTSKDKDGNICANYGYIKRELEITSKGKFKFEYWLNTNSTSRSLEWIGNVPHDQRKNYK